MQIVSSIQGPGYQVEVEYAWLLPVKSCSAMDY